MSWPRVAAAASESACRVNMRESETRMSIKKRLMTACAGVLVAGGLASVANATLTIDLKVAPTTPGVSADGKWVARSLVAGESIFIQIYATVSGAHAGFSRVAVLDEFDEFTKWEYQFDGIDGLQSLSGSIIATQVGGGAVLPDLKSAILAKGVNTHVSASAAWDGQGSSSGDKATRRDLNADGVYDLGSPDGTPSDLASQYVNIRGKDMTYNEANPSIVTANEPRPQDAPSITFLVGQIAFRVGNPKPGIGETDINWVTRKTAGKIESNAALWMEDRFLDGAPKESDPKDGVSGAIIIGGPVHLGLIPEPMSLSVFGVGAALLGLRRNRR